MNSITTQEARQQRRGGSVYARDTSQIKLQRAGQPEPKRGCFKPGRATLHDSLRSSRSRRSSGSVAERLVGRFWYTSPTFSTVEVHDSSQTIIDTTDASTSQSHLPKRVKFGTMQIREYETIASDNPGVSWGAASLGIGWTYQEAKSVSVDAYEQLHPTRRTLKEIKVPLAERLKRLKESGCSTKEIRKISKQINIAKRKRRGTLERLHLHSLHEQLESIKIRIQRAIGLKHGNDVQEDQLWSKAQQVIGTSATVVM